MNKLKYICTSLGCHQRPDRSFFFKGKQFPLCARCTGVLLGQILACILIVWYKPNIYICIAFLIIMFIDWYIQYLKIKESTNIRRFITGLLCGYGLFTIYIYIALLCFKIIIR